MFWSICQVFISQYTLAAGSKDSCAAKVLPQNFSHSNHWTHFSGKSQEVPPVTPLTACCSQADRPTDVAGCLLTYPTPKLSGWNENKEEFRLSITPRRLTVQSKGFCNANVYKQALSQVQSQVKCNHPHYWRQALDPGIVYFLSWTPATFYLPASQSPINLPSISPVPMEPIWLHHYKALATQRPGLFTILPAIWTLPL